MESEPMQEAERQPDLPPARGKNRRTAIFAIVLFLLVIAGMFIFAAVYDGSSPSDDESNTADVDDRYSSITRIDGKHFYIDGVHTVVGEIPMPTPCDLLESDAMIAESMPEQITLNFSVINNAEFCPQVITPQRFKQSATASSGATFSANFNGRPVELNLVEAGPDESPDDFELFIKG